MCIYKATDPPPNKLDPLGSEWDLPNPKAPCMLIWETGKEPLLV